MTRELAIVTRIEHGHGGAPTHVWLRFEDEQTVGAPVDFPIPTPSSLAVGDRVEVTWHPTKDGPEPTIRKVGP